MEDGWGLSICLLCSSRNVGEKGVMCFICDIVVPTLNANYTPCNLKALLYGGALRVE